MTGRRRSSSIAGPAETPSLPPPKSNSLTLEALEATQKLWELVCYAMEDPLSKQTLLHSSSNVCLIKALLDRAHQLDYYSRTFVPPKGKTNTMQSSHWLSTMLRLGDGESGYTPLHRAVLKADLPVLLLLLHYTTSLQSKDSLTLLKDSRMLHRPLELLQGDVSLGEDVRAVFQAVDQEGMTAFQLMERLQVRELERCRMSLRLLEPNTQATNSTPETRRPRQNSLEAMLQEEHAREQNEFAELHNFLQQEQEREESVFRRGANGNAQPNYACEVLAFGRSNHLALGVQGGSKNHAEASSSESSASMRTTYRPHRVQTFAQDRVGRAGSAVAIAAAAHHTLVATRDGQLFAFGVGTGGRLGTGDNEKHCPAPTRVMGALKNRQVVAIAAAENHSLCVTSDGAVYAFGSNRFGQLGYSSTGSGDTNDSGSSSKCCLPRRVDDLWKKHILCTSVAAGEKHSVALSQKGEVYVWGCNGSGQLGIHRRSTSNSAMAHKVQRVDALWSEDKKRICFKVAASSQATLVLAKPSSGGLPVNQVYAWGHGNHVPSKVQFVDSNESESRGEGRDNVFMAAGNGRRAINPVEIACARHHNAAITSDGRVYTWGFHADPLGGGASKQGTPKSLKNACSQPRLVTGMLPEEGGGFAVAVSASENHTAVVTNEGSLFTWGASNGKGLLGHEGVRWQPNPKRVSGVSRAVGISAAKEHTILLMGTSFPIRDEDPRSSAAMSLECLASQEVIRHVDLFNVLPILMTAERTNCRYVIEYCHDFIRLNMDGILNVGQKSNMDMFLKEQVASGLLLLDEEARDRRERPLVLDVALAAQRNRHGLYESETILSDPVDWIQACERLFKKDSLNALLNRMRKNSRARHVGAGNPRYLRWRSSSSVGSFAEAYNKGGSRNRSSSLASASEAEKDANISSSERCIMLTTNMDLSTRESVQAKYDCLTKEIRGLKKRLGQISKLEEMQSDDDPNKSPITLSAEQMEKVARRPQLESELCIFEPALERVERRMLQFNLRLKRFNSVGNEEEEMQKSEEKKMVEDMKEAEGEEGNPGLDPAGEGEPKTSILSLRCALCKVTCPDDKSYALHMNGRKHRNRVLQEAEEEKKKAAALMMEESNRQKMEDMTKSADTREKPKAPSPWSKAQSARAATPKYKLPPPESAAQELVVEVKDKPKSFQEIMAEEAKRSGNLAGAKKRPTKASPAPKPLQLPPGSAPSIKSPPWARNPVVASSTASPAPLPTPLRNNTPNLKSNQSSPWQQAPASPATAIPVLQPQKGSTPPLKSPPWATPPTTAVASKSAPVLPSVAAPKSSSSFGDFIRKSPSTPQQVKAGVSSAPWSASAVPKNVPGAALSGKPKASPSSGVKFHEIQKEEADFRDNLQDQSYQDNSSWFIGRRERAGSFATIQEEANREREQQLFIEEQKRIEEQILREVALQKKKEEKKKRQQAKKKAKQNQSQAKGQEDGTAKKKRKPPQKKNNKGTALSEHEHPDEGRGQVASDLPQQKMNEGTGDPQKDAGNSKKNKNNNRRKANKRKTEKKPVIAEATAPSVVDK